MAPKPKALKSIASSLKKSAGARSICTGGSGSGGLDGTDHDYATIMIDGKIWYFWGNDPTPKPHPPPPPPPPPPSPPSTTGGK